MRAEARADAAAIKRFCNKINEVGFFVSTRVESLSIKPQ
jgi:hypothetical protein